MKTETSGVRTSRPDGGQPDGATAVDANAALTAAGPTFAFHADLCALVGRAQTDSIVSRQVLNDEHVKVTLFAFAAGQELSEHTASKPAIIQVLAGEGTFGLGAEDHEVATGSWAHMAPDLPHTIRARTPLVLLLTMIKAPRGGDAERPSGRAAETPSA